jgi:hypothetical protein
MFADLKQALKRGKFIINWDAKSMGVDEFKCMYF